ncbi:Serine/threonine-protein phosphatase 2A 55 kDa regulatory subunit B [Fasciola gigantica]|uniref:Serine/threonine-protein phosphatase 2A 55 kDa regulatory subunit B n=1 Tax=Fasciola gigantica TaxID=46835 RepID=A0A504YQN0_FASGI|nr:Serine/threonine-protein phosphatase 2A 55 kDa regulatory subunit B [Fasciola gigantica]
MSLIRFLAVGSTTQQALFKVVLSPHSFIRLTINCPPPGFFNPQQKPQIRVNHNVYCTFVSHEPGIRTTSVIGKLRKKLNQNSWFYREPIMLGFSSPLMISDATVAYHRASQASQLYNLTARSAVGNPQSLMIQNPTVNHLSESMNNHPIRTDSSRVNTPRFCSPADLRVPRFEDIEPTVEAIPRRVFANAHAYLINSLSVNSDQETFLSADRLCDMHL